MSDVNRETRFACLGGALIKHYYPLLQNEDVTVFNIGDKVRVYSKKCNRFCGELLNVLNDTVVIKLDGETSYAVTIRFNHIADIVKNTRVSQEKDPKTIFAEMAGGSPADSLHDLTVKLMFGDGCEPEFHYKDISENTNKMPHERFEELLDELDGNSLKTLKEKNARYSSDGDALHNFRKGADFTGGTVAQTCWDYMSKHLVALQDKVLRNDFSDRDDFLEKCQDTINYVRFLCCIGN